MSDTELLPKSKPDARRKADRDSDGRRTAIAPSQICLPELRAGGGSGAGARTADQGWAADRGVTITRNCAEPEDTNCPCCREPMHVIGEETSKRLDVIAARFPPICRAWT